MPFKPGEIPQGAKPFPKGTSGNPEGRPPGIRNRQTVYGEITDLPISVLKIEMDHLPPDIDVAKAIAIQQSRKAILESDSQAAKEVFDSAYGKNADVLIDQSGPKKMVMVVTNGDIDPPEAEATE